jgi:hypothetical protein
MCLADENRSKVECADGSSLRRYTNAPPESNHIVLSARPLAPKLHFAIRQRLLAGLTVALALSWVVGCGSSTKITIVGNPTGVASLPAESTPGPINTYVGTQSPGAWTVSLNDTNSTYSYQPITFPGSPNTPASGAFTSSHGFLDLGHANDSSLGYILEVPGRFAMLRPGDTTAPLIVGVPQASCYPIPYRLRFEYVGMEAGSDEGGNDALIAGGASAGSGAYGSFVINTDAAGASWQFQDSAGNAVLGPSGFAGNCTVAGGATTVNLSGEGLFDQYNYGTSLAFTNQNSTSTFQMGPSGIFIIDQSDTTARTQAPQLKGSGIAGVAQPTSAVSTTDISTGTYLGFLTEAEVTFGGGSPLPRFTTPVAFSPTAPSGATIIGGRFPNDDLSQPPGSEIAIALGKQDSKVNGLFTSAKITAPDPQQNCALHLASDSSLPLTVGTDANGFTTCTFPAVAVVGNPDGKYAIFLDAFNYTVTGTPAQGQSQSLGTPMQIYLYQQ